MTKNNMLFINGLMVNYHQLSPNNPVVVFLHDSLGCIELWRDFPQKLAAETNCNILIYDRLGYGKSNPMPTHERAINYLEVEADVLNDLLTTLKIDNAILFGHSDGGSIALIAASKHPQRIKAVIAEAGHVFVEEVTLKGIQEAVEAYKTTNLAERLQRYHGDKVDTLFKAWTETWMRNNYKDWNIEHFLAGINCPLLFIQGEEDEFGSLEQVEKTIRQTSAKAQKYIIPNVGHTPHKEVPELTIQATAEFIRSLL